MQSSPDGPVLASVLGVVKPTKSVICSVLAFLEAAQEDIESQLQLVQQKVVKENGIVGQGRLVPQHLERFGLPIDNFAGDRSGRKTPQVKQIIPRLVGRLLSQGYDSAAPADKIQMLHELSEPFRSRLGLSLGPMRITPAGMSAAAVVEELLRQAEARGIVSAIAELLVGSKLEICLGGQHGAKVAKQHKWENGHDDPDDLGDYRIENVAIEVTMVRGPDEAHRSKTNRITAGGVKECWLIVRSDKIKAWQDYVAKAPSRYPNLVRCFGICEFIGQNLTETRWRSCDGGDPLRDVVVKLNELVSQLGSQFLPAASVELID